MWGLIIVGLAFIGMGVFMLMSPDNVRGWEETRNSYHGYQSDHGERYKTGLKVRGFVMIAIGIGISTMPLWVLALVGN